MIIGPGDTGPVWVDQQMDHGSTIPMPPSMTPDLPQEGEHRLVVELQVHNKSEEHQIFSASDFVLESSGGKYWTATSVTSDIQLLPGQFVVKFVSFDVPSPPLADELRLAWHKGQSKMLMQVVSHPPDHALAEGPDTPINWPRDAEALPSGDFGRGKVIYTAKCWGCHGHPENPGTNTVGPHLGKIAEWGSRRIAGLTSKAYAYQSILFPNAFIAPKCKLGPCPKPSQMPDYRSLLNKQQMSDLLSYLLSDT